MKKTVKCTHRNINIIREKTIIQKLEFEEHTKRLIEYVIIIEEESQKLNSLYEMFTIQKSQWMKFKRQGLEFMIKDNDFVVEESGKSCDICITAIDLITKNIKSTKDKIEYGMYKFREEEKKYTEWEHKYVDDVQNLLDK